MLLRFISLLAVVLVVSGCGPSAPDRDQMEALAGAALEKPLRLGGPFDAWFNHSRAPLPNQMVVQTEDGGPQRYLWLYPLRADSAYRPPASSPFECEVERLGDVTLHCAAEARDERGAWAYAVEFFPEYGGGSFSATLTPE